MFNVVVKDEDTSLTSVARGDAFVFRVRGVAFYTAMNESWINNDA